MKFSKPEKSGRIWRRAIGLLSLHLSLGVGIGLLSSSLQITAFASSTIKDTCEVDNDALIQVRVDSSVDAEAAEVAGAIKDFRLFFEDSIAPIIPCELRQALVRRGTTTMITITRQRLEGHSTFAETIPTGNGPEVFVRSTRLAADDVRRAIAHEIFHALHYWLRGYGSIIVEDRWVAEGLATFFESRAMGYLHGHKLSPPKDFVLADERDPNTSLVAGRWDMDTLVYTNYGHFYQYFSFLYKRCGGDKLMWSIAPRAGGLVGGGSIDHALAMMPTEVRQAPECASFAASAQTFEIARIHNHAQTNEPEQSAESSRYVLDPDWDGSFFSYESPEHFREKMRQLADDAHEHQTPLPPGWIDPAPIVDCPPGVDQLPKGGNCGWGAVVASLPAWQPLLVDGNVVLPPSILKHVTRIWSERSGKHRVSLTAPTTDLDSWRQILIVETPVITK